MAFRDDRCSVENTSATYPHDVSKEYSRLQLYLLENKFALLRGLSNCQVAVVMVGVARLLWRPSALELVLFGCGPSCDAGSTGKVEWGQATPTCPSKSRAAVCIRAINPPLPVSSLLSPNVIGYLIPPKRVANVFAFNFVRL